MDSLLCSAHSDAMLGPRVDPACRPFDFTVYFEDLVLFCVPSAIFMILIPSVLWSLARTRPAVTPSWLLYAKIATLSAITMLQLAFLVLRQRTEYLINNASTAADVLCLLSFVGAITLSYFDHIRSVRPSTLLALYLSAWILFVTTRTRTLWLIWLSGDIPVSIPLLSSLLLVLSLGSLMLESLEKRSSVQTVKPSSTPEMFSGFWKRSSFAWLAATFRAGYTRIISVNELPELDPKLDSDVLLHQLDAVWSKSDKSKKYSLLKACFRAYMGPLFSAVIPRLCLTGFRFAQPFLINATITYVGMNNPDPSIGRSLIGAYALVYLGMAFSTALYWYQTFRFLTRLRGGLIALTYKQTLQARAIDLGETTAVTLMGTDVERIVVNFRPIHELWASVLDVSIGIFLLEREVGVACVMPALITIIFTAITFKISGRLNALQKRWIEKVQQRLKITASMLGDMSAIKMLGLADKMESILQTLRKEETQKSEKYRKLMIWELFLSNGPLYLAPMMTFVVFIIIAVVRKDATLVTSQAFTALSLVALVTDPFCEFIQTIPGIVQSMGCFDRIQGYCRAPPASVMDASSSTPSTTMLELQNFAQFDSKTSAINSQFLIAFKDCDFGWQQSKEPTLRHITLEIATKSTTTIVGPVGSGKSTLLESVLGESIQLGGHTTRNDISIAYCSQTAWLMNQSARSNIIGVAAYEEDWYTTVIWACELEEDFAKMDQGDKTVIGSNGLNLSGGQKQRIALARAVYSRRMVILLDDIFSGMDSRTVAAISNRLFGEQGLFRKHEITVLMTTHSHKLLLLADNVVVLENGRITESGSLHNMLAGNSYVSRMTSKSSTDDSTESSLHSSSGEATVGVAKASLPEEVDRDPLRRQGDLSVYRYYAQAAGSRPVIAFLGAVILYAFFTQFPTVWIKLWTDANARVPNENAGMYIGVYVFLSLAGTFSMVVACWTLFINMVSNSSLKMHQDLLQAALKAPFSFFSKTDVGSLMNRFSQDMELIGMAIPMMTINYVASASSLFVKVIVLVIFAEYLGITLPFTAAIIFYLQKFYLRTSRQVRLLDIEAKAPLYTLFMESVTGATTIRAMGWKSHFDASCHKFLDMSQRPVYMLYCIQQWLSLILDLVVAILAVILVGIVTTWSDRFTAGSVGVSLIVVMTFNQTLMQLIRSWTLLETSIGAVARVKNFVTNTESESIPAVSSKLPENWPSSGAIQFSKVFASYSTPENPVLRDFTISIKAGEKIAICGRSGSGKTSLILSLLQMLQVDQGNVTIDGRDIANISYVDLRSRINVIPQAPFLMPGTIRFNIDPFQSVTDEDIVRALQKVGLWTQVQLLGGLDTSTSMEAWSVGQRQLLCLARALVRKSKILILDEATSSVDHNTEAVMQEIIDTEFADCTVLAVMHRLSFVTNYDRVALLDSGRLLEFDSPQALLEKPSSFAELYRSSGHKI